MMEKLVYLVEDDEDIREMIEYLLGETTYRVYSFGTATALHQMMPMATPDLLIMDIMLPDGNGIEICRNMKSAAGTRSTPILLMSANLDNQLKSMECQADDFINKPFDINRFMEKVNHLISV